MGAFVKDTKLIALLSSNSKLCNPEYGGKKIEFVIVFLADIVRKL